MRVGILGFGAMGRAHSWCINNLKYFYKPLDIDVSIAGVCTSSIESARAAAELLGVSAHTCNEDDLIYDPNIDIIDICTPNIYHYETLKKAIAAGKHIYCEKPLCVTYEQAKEISELADAAGITAQIVFNNRFLPAVMRAKSLISSGRLGRVLSFRCEYLHASAADPAKSSGWKQNRDVCGAGTLYDLGAHAVDLMYHLCGRIVKVIGQGQIAYPERLGTDGKPWHTNADEAFYMICTTEDNAVGTIEVNKLVVGANDDLNFTVRGEKGTVGFSLMEPNWLQYYDACAEGGEYGGSKGFTRIECCGRYEAPGGVFPSFKAPIGWLRGHLHSMYSFLCAVQSGTSASPSFSDGAEVQKVLQMAMDNDISGIY